MINGVSIQLAAHDAEVFLHNLMFPSEITLEARQNFLQGVENNIRIESHNGEAVIYSDQINTDALSQAINSGRLMQEVPQGRMFAEDQSIYRSSPVVKSRMINKDNSEETNRYKAFEELALMAA